LVNTANTGPRRSPGHIFDLFNQSDYECRGDPRQRVSRRCEPSRAVPRRPHARVRAQGQGPRVAGPEVRETAKPF
jgi:hypothetical protein